MNSGEPPKYRLVPDTDGTYTLERYHEDVDMYLSVKPRVTEEQADKMIESLERGIKYYREE